MRLAIFGSRSLFGSAVRSVLAEYIDKHGATEIITAGEPQGVCDEARHVSKELSIPIKMHWLNAKERCAGKYHWRSVAVLSDCDSCLFLHDGKSKGTANEIKVAVKLGVAHEVITMKPQTDSSAIMAAIQSIKGI
jgi:nitric oxide synthase oxygenase domain/subunit